MTCGSTSTRRSAADHGRNRSSSTHIDHEPGAAGDGVPDSLAGVTIDVEFGAPLPPIVIVGDRYRLRPFRPEDLHLVEEATRDDVIPLISTVPRTWTPVEGHAFIERQNSRLSNGEGWSLAIVELTSNRAVGQVGLWISHLHRGRAEIGYWVGASGRREGAASFAVEALSDWAFEHLDVDRLSLFIEPWNTASIKTAERAGYEFEALLESWERVGGVSRDMGSYVRTRRHQTG